MAKVKKTSHKQSGQGRYEAELRELQIEFVKIQKHVIKHGIQILKYYLDISRKEQKRRLRDRRHDPLKQWKTSPIDEVAVKHWDDYTEARDQMLDRTSSPLSPWIVVRADNKHTAHLNVIPDLLARLACPQTDKHLAVPDLDVVFPYDEAHPQADSHAT